MTTRLATHQMVNQCKLVLVTHHEQHTAIIYSNTYENRWQHTAQCKHTTLENIHKWLSFIAIFIQCNIWVLYVLC